MDPFKLSPAKPPETKWTEGAPELTVPSGPAPVVLAHLADAAASGYPERVEVQGITYRRIGTGYVSEDMLKSGFVTERKPAPAATGARFNNGKLRMSLVPASFGRYCAAGLGYGALKYAPHNWLKGFDWSQVLDSLQRHLDAFKEGEDIDAESGLPHLALAACNLAFLIEFFDKGKGNDDRFFYDGQPRGTLLPGRVLQFRQPPVQQGAAGGPGAGTGAAADPQSGAS